MLILDQAKKHQEGHIQIENWPLPLLKEENSERDRLCQSLGFIYQTTQLMRPPFFSEREKTIWGRAFPTIYSYGMSSGQRKIESMPRGRTLKDWNTYSFDTIPTFALRKIQEAIDSRFFIDVHIWTPEKFLVDPIVVGIRDNQVFPLVRWGEALKDKTEIAIMSISIPLEFISEQVKTRIVDTLWNHQWDDYFLAIGCPCQKRPFQSSRNKCKKHRERIYHFHSTSRTEDTARNPLVFCMRGELDCQ